MIKREIKRYEYTGLPGTAPAKTCLPCRFQLRDSVQTQSGRIGLSWPGSRIGLSCISARLLGPSQAEEIRRVMWHMRLNEACLQWGRAISRCRELNRGRTVLVGRDRRSLLRVSLFYRDALHLDTWER